MLDLAVLPESDPWQEPAAALAQALSLTCLPVVSPADLPDDAVVLLVGAEGLSLQQGGCRAPGPVQVDFATGALHWRSRQGDGLLAKAIGIKPHRALHVVDATAGFGVDGFMLATMGCRVTWLERHPVVQCLLQDGLERGRRSEFADVVEACQRIELLRGDACQWLPGLTADVVYLDPMFPERKKSAQVKKSMQYFHQLVGPDEDAESLLAPALAAARYRVVVKRPRIAPPLALHTPSFQVSGKAHRFDVYALKALP